MLKEFSQLQDKVQKKTPLNNFASTIFFEGLFVQEIFGGNCVKLCEILKKENEKNTPYRGNYIFSGVHHALITEIGSKIVFQDPTLLLFEAIDLNEVFENGSKKIEAYPIINGKESEVEIRRISSEKFEITKSITRKKNERKLKLSFDLNESSEGHKGLKNKEILIFSEILAIRVLIKDLVLFFIHKTSSGENYLSDGKSKKFLEKENPERTEEVFDKISSYLKISKEELRKHISQGIESYKKLKQKVG